MRDSTAKQNKYFKMANRNVFKILSSVGPGGCIAVFCEKICHHVFYDAYEQGDPMCNLSEEQENKAKEQRQAFITELFNKRGGFERDLESFDEEKKQSAYVAMASLIIDHKGRIARSETTRLARERLQFKATSIAYRRRVEASKRVESDTLDNLMKMTLHIVKTAESQLLIEAYETQGGKATSQIKFDMEDGRSDIRERISVDQAERYLTEWKKILYVYKKEGNDVDALFAGQGSGSESGSPVLEDLKDKLYIQTGEDITDTWEAFSVYTLAVHLSQDDIEAIESNMEGQRV